MFHIISLCFKTTLVRIKLETIKDHSDGNERVENRKSTDEMWQKNGNYY